MLTLKTRLIFKLWERMFGVRTLFSASLDRYLGSIHGIFPSYLTTKRDILAKHIRKGKGIVLRLYGFTEVVYSTTTVTYMMVTRYC